ncbi:MAG: SDR family NAD(P)-dependent oxidoreductase [Pseudomonadota bacterium]
MSSQVIAITGAFGALGSHVAKAFVNDGARVGMVDLGDARPTLPASEATLLLPKIDLNAPGAADAAMSEIVKKFGRLDALINIAGGFTWQTVADGNVETWDQMYEANVRSAFLATKAAAPHIAKVENGRIIMIGAQAALQASLGMGAYAAAKSGVMRLTEAMAAEMKASGATVNAVLPSIIDTPANRKDMPDANPSDWVSLDELTSVIQFLVSPAASAVTGALIPVTGRL